MPTNCYWQWKGEEGMSTTSDKTHPDYPCPCLKCTDLCAALDGSNAKKCLAYRVWFLWWWKYFRKIFSTTAEKNVFTYFHPEERKDQIRKNRADTAAQIRAKSAKKPCDHCKQNEDCDIPCDAYLHWYDESLALIRKLTGK